MNRHIFGASAVLAAACIASGAVHAHDRTQWSVTVGNQPRGVVVPQSQFSYGAPPSVYTPPPQVYGAPPMYGPPAVVYVQPPSYPVYVNPPVRIESYPHGRDRHDHQRRDWNDNRQGQWGYGQGPHRGYGQGSHGGYGHGHYRR